MDDIKRDQGKERTRKRPRDGGKDRNGSRDGTFKDKRLASRLSQTEQKLKHAAEDALRSELLLADEAGMLEAEGPMEATWRFKQNEIRKHVDIQTASRMVSLDLTELGPYIPSYTRSGRHMLLAGRKGHIALLDTMQMKVVKELQLRESVRDVTFLHNELMFAVAQKKYVYIYDSQGLELHCMRQHVDPLKLDFLPYHFLLVSAGRAGWLKYHDVSTGQLIAEHGTKGPCQSLRHNPDTAVIHLGHKNGVVSLWSPSSSKPLVQMLCHRGPVTSLAMDRQGRYMATSGMDGVAKMWDLRTYKMLHAYQMATPAATLDISQRGLLAMGYGCHVEVWRDALSTKARAPYLRHDIPGSSLDTLRFQPYEDILGLGHRDGFVSMVVPGAGEPNFDTLEANPFQTKKQRREAEVHQLLDKLQPEMIMLDPTSVATVDKDPKQLQRELQEIMDEADRRKDKPKKEKRKARGRDKIGLKLRRKQKNVIDAKTVLLKQKLAEQEALKKGKQERETEKGRGAPRALQRFF